MPSNWDVKPRFELQHVREDGSKEIELCDLKEFLRHGAGGLKMGRRGFLGLSAFSSAALLAACQAAALSPTPTAQATATVAPTATDAATSTLQPTLAPSATDIPTDTPVPSPTSVEIPHPTAQPAVVNYEDPAGAACGAERAEAAGVGGIAFNAGGGWLVSATQINSDARHVKIWDATTGELLQSWTAGYRIKSIAISPDSGLLVIGGYAAVELRQAQGGQLIKAIEDLSLPIDAVAISPDGSLLAALIDERELHVWTLGGGYAHWQLEGTFKSVAFSPDGTRLATGSDASIDLWDPASGRRLGSLGSNTADVLCFSADGSLLNAAGYDGQAAQWEVASGRLVHSASFWKAPTGSLAYSEAIASGAFSPDGRQLALVVVDLTDPMNPTEAVRLYDPATGRRIRTLKASSGDLVFSPNGERLVQGGLDGVIRVWSAKTGQPLGVCFFDPAENTADESAVTYKLTDAAGITRTYALPCGSPIPGGAICTCNCVAGTYIETPGGGGGGGTICTCVPVYVPR